MRKIYVDVTTQLIIQADEGVEVNDILDEMDYNFNDTTGKADIVDTTITDYEITDSK